jgi:hypothetical protein
MPKFRISYTIEDWWTLEVEASDMDDAMEKFMSGEYNHEDAVLTEGGFLQDSVEIEKVT